MGQETSSLVSDDTRPDTLSDRSIAAVADLIKRGRAKRIVVMTGAGISTAAGSEFLSSVVQCLKYAQLLVMQSQLH
ncbi:hypothetical protein RRF57_009711 [Xylaria bambusicola]|uniref:Deacetylase sirtuin-type domain-containing protein n=1 Tax=Xylaria bambusicola TaxID=326684 RepID=A0AAN7Z949_9PEZI